jgi:hypothetical protein
MYFKTGTTNTGGWPMTHEELEKLLGGEEIHKALDVKTLVLDIVREMPQEELLEIFWSRLSTLSPEFTRDYLYMKRT